VRLLSAITDFDIVEGILFKNIINGFLPATNKRRNVMKYFAALFVAAAFCCPLFAQAPSAPNSVYFELLGNGLMYSLNYDRMFNESIGARAGIGYFSPEDEAVMTFPIMLNYLYGSGNSKLELGGGVTVISQSENVSFKYKTAKKDFKGSGVLGTITVGYRYQKPEKGVLFRAGFTPLFGEIGFGVSLGVSVGYGF
jgi:hypothetical protein